MAKQNKGRYGKNKGRFLVVVRGKKKNSIYGFNTLKIRNSYVRELKRKNKEYAIATIPKKK